MQTSSGMDDGSPIERIGLGARVLGILTSPRVTFERVVADPRWIGMLTLGVGAVAVLGGLLMSADFAQREMLDRQIASMEAFGVTMTDEVYATLEQQLRSAPYTTFGFLLVGVPIVCATLAGMLHAVGHGVLGAGASFGQAFAVVVHAGAVFLPQQLFVVPLNYARESITAPATLAAFAPLLDDETFTYKLLNAVDLFYVWWVMVLAIGMAVLWKRRTAPIAFTLYGIYAGVAVIIATARTTFGF